MAGNFYTRDPGTGGNFQTHDPTQKVSTQINLDSSSSALATVSSSLSTLITATINALATAVVTATLTTTISITETIPATATETQDLSTTIVLDTRPVNGLSSSNQIDLTTTIALDSSSSASASETDNGLITSIEAASNLSAIASCSNTLTTDIPLDSTSLANATATGDITTQLLLDGNLSCVATADPLDIQTAIEITISLPSTATITTDLLTAIDFVSDGLGTATSTAQISTTVALASSDNAIATGTANATTDIIFEAVSASGLASIPTQTLFTEIDMVASDGGIGYVSPVDIVTAIDFVSDGLANATFSPNIITEILFTESLISQADIAGNLLTAIDFVSDGLGTATSTADFTNSIEFEQSTLPSIATVSPTDIVTDITISETLLADATINAVFTTTSNISSTAQATAICDGLLSTQIVFDQSQAICGATQTGDLLTDIIASASLPATAQQTNILSTTISFDASNVAQAIIQDNLFTEIIYPNSTTNAQSSFGSPSIITDIEIAQTIGSIGNISGTLTTSIELPQTNMPSRATVTNALTTSIDLSSDIAAVATANANILTASMMSSIQATTLLRGDLITDIVFDTNAVGNANLDATNITTAITQAANPQAAAIIDAVLTNEIVFEQQAFALADQTNNIDTIIIFNSDLTATSTISCDLTTDITLSETTGASSSFAGDILTAITVGAPTANASASIVNPVLDTAITPSCNAVAFASGSSNLTSGITEASDMLAVSAISCDLSTEIVAGNVNANAIASAITNGLISEIIIPQTISPCVSTITSHLTTQIYLDSQSNSIGNLDVNDIVTEINFGIDITGVSTLNAKLYEDPFIAAAEVVADLTTEILFDTQFMGANSSFAVVDLVTGIYASVAIIDTSSLTAPLTTDIIFDQIIVNSSTDFTTGFGLITEIAPQSDMVAICDFTGADLGLNVEFICQSTLEAKLAETIRFDGKSSFGAWLFTINNRFVQFDLPLSSTKEVSFDLPVKSINEIVFDLPITTQISQNRTEVVYDLPIINTFEVTLEVQ